MILDELKNKLVQLGVKKGDVLCVFSDLKQFGIPSELRTLVIRNGPLVLLQSYVETFEAVLGEGGTLIMPTFTYSACKSEVFDVATSPSTVGALTEYFRKMQGVQRSIHPIFSFCGKGPRIAELFSMESFDSFGKDSFFSKMIRVGGLYLLLGTDLENSATFMYASLQKKQVDYRFIKSFNGVVQNGSHVLKAEVPFFVRDLASPIEEPWNWLEEVGAKNGVVKIGKYLSGRLLLTEAKKIDELACSELERNPHCFIKEAV